MGTDVDPMNAGKDEFFGDELGEAGEEACVAPGRSAML